ncbi:MAG: RNA-binding S4 domain-containing protein [Burkholderiales bacterium]
MPEADARLRLDKWLWAARFCKTRALAARAVESGKVLLNGARVKPSKTLHAGDALEIRQGPYRYHIVVRELSLHRGSATEAARLYEETAEGKKIRAQLKTQLQSQPQRLFKGRPTKKARRQLQKLDWA